MTIPAVPFPLVPSSHPLEATATADAEPIFVAPTYCRLWPASSTQTLDCSDLSLLVAFRGPR